MAAKPKDSLGDILRQLFGPGSQEEDDSLEEALEKYGHEDDAGSVTHGYGNNLRSRCR